MGRPNQGNKAQTPVGYSHGDGVYTGGLATAVLGVVARDTAGGHGFVLGQATLLPVLRCMRFGLPQGVLHGVAGTACRPWERQRSNEVCVEECDGVVVRWIVWRAYLRWHYGLGGALTRGTRSSR